VTVTVEKVFHCGVIGQQVFHWSFTLGAWAQIEALMTGNDVKAIELARIAGVGPSAVTKWKTGGKIRSE
jgi:hypothetical protein